MQLNELQIDFFRETFNISVGKGAKVLNAMLNSQIELIVPKNHLINTSSDMSIESGSNNSTVNLQFEGKLKGTCQLLFPLDSALDLVSNVTGQFVEGRICDEGTL